MQFKVGEIAIIQNAVNNPANNGTEVEVIGSLAPRNTRTLGNDAIENVYVVRRSDGQVWHCLPVQLRKKNNPSKQDTTTWEEFKKVCGFDPSKVSA